MRAREPIAFISYVRSDDLHDSGQITHLRERLEGEVRIQTGKPFDIFQDRNDIKWGDSWRDRIDGAIFDATFLFPIITPSYFNSSMCRDEFQKFLKREETLGVRNLIFPFYYVECDQLDSLSECDDQIAGVIRERNWVDWRKYRFSDLRQREAAEAICGFASDIKNAIKNINSIAAVSRERSSYSHSSESETIPAMNKQSAAEYQNTLDRPQGSRKPRTRVSAKQALLSPDDTVVESSKPYDVFTTEYDEVIRADELIDIDELSRLHKSLLLVVKSCLGVSSIRDFAEAILPGVPRRDAAISILLDNSGSMRGNKMQHASAWSLIATEALEYIGCKVEVLGFTTRAWKGGQSREKWLAGGRPSYPGRLNDLRHIVYKGFDESSATAGPNFSLMNREGVLKENIDGEALVWAHSRLSQVTAATKALVVLSDGAPVDDSTIACNGSKFLHDHLLHVTSTLSKDAEILLKAIGIEFDVSRYYQDCDIAWNVTELGSTLQRQLNKILSGAP